MALLVLLVGLGGAYGQSNREAKPGEDGLLAIVPFKAEKCTACSGKGQDACRWCKSGEKKLDIKCPECKGKKSVGCRPCGATGSTFDSMTTILCPLCEGSTVVKCLPCGGEGFYKAQDGRKGAGCKLCDKQGFHKCDLCAGKRLIKLDAVAGKSIEAATADEAKEALKKYQPILDACESYAKPDSTKSADNYAKIFEKATAAWPYVKATGASGKKRYEFVLEKMKTDFGANHEEAVKNTRLQVIYAIRYIAGTHVNLLNWIISVSNKNREIADQKAREKK